MPAVTVPTLQRSNPSVLWLWCQIYRTVPVPKIQGFSRTVRFLLLPAKNRLSTNFCSLFLSKGVRLYQFFLGYRTHRVEVRDGMLVHVTVR